MVILVPGWLSSHFLSFDVPACTCNQETHATIYWEHLVHFKTGLKLESLCAKQTRLSVFHGSRFNLSTGKAHILPCIILTYWKWSVRRIVILKPYKRISVLFSSQLQDYEHVSLWNRFELNSLPWYFFDLTIKNYGTCFCNLHYLWWVLYFAVKIRSRFYVFNLI